MSLLPPRLRIPYISCEFPCAPYPIYSELPTSWDEIIWAALTIGRPSVHHVFQHGASSFYEAMFRIGLVRMALEQYGPNARRLRRTDALKNLDPTEKGAVSYFLGMTFCKVFASSILETPWLLHLDAFKGGFTLQSLGRSRPDLVGQRSTTGGWLAFETKGRASKPSADDQNKAKAQAQRVARVAGSTCEMRIGTFAYFNGDVLNFLWIDPSPGSEKSIDLPSPRDAWKFYYEPVQMLWLNSSEEIVDEKGNVFFSIAGMDIKIFIHRKLAVLLREGAWKRAQSEMFDAMELLKSENFQSDGLRVVCGRTWMDRVSSFAQES